MNFFEHQDQARKYTKWLVFLFILSVACLILLTDLLVVILFYVSDHNRLLNSESHSFANIPIQVHVIVALVICSAVLLACFYRVSQLKAGGVTIANELGGTYISPSTTDPDERKILNVVEEMAIASGTSVPSVYVLDDSAINAFAAGYSMHDAVIGITRGAIQLLNREELQGVIAHEFSHILNGDMRINIKLTGILFGIIFLSIIGQQILRGAHISRSSRDNAAAVILLGLGLILIGSVGMLFGGMIKAAVSRQREYLADASAVQFTRNPESIGGALKKIGGWPVGSHLAAEKAAEYSHFYIAEGVSKFAAGFFKTHPPLDDRISRIMPSWDGAYPEVKPPKQSFSEAIEQEKQKSFESSTMITAAVLAQAIEEIGVPTKNHVQYAHTILEQIPGVLLEAAHEPHSAYALALALTLNEDPNTWNDQIKHLDTKADFRVVEQLQSFLPSLAVLNTRFRLPLIEICIPSLKLLADEKKANFKRDMKLIIHEDKKLELWEWVLYRLFTLSFDKPDLSGPRYNKIKHLSDDCRLLLAAIAYSGCKKSVDAKTTFTQASNKLELNTELPSKKDISGAKLSKAIENLRLLKPLEKPKLLKALCSAAQIEGKVHYREVELIRMIADGIDCPMPPILS